MAAALIAPAGASAAIDFDPGADFPAGNQAAEVEVLDANRDGIPDLAVGAQTLNLLPGLGAGAVDTPVPLDPEVEPGNGLVAARLNSDRRPDLAVTDDQFGPSRISVLLSKRNGDFRAPRHFRAGEGANGLAAGDFDGDGNRDLATQGRVLFGKGDGSFGRARRLDALTSGRVAAGDINGDGRDDLASSNGSANEVVLAFGLGNRRFRTPAPVNFGLVTGALDIADVDGDGRRDIGVAHSIQPGNDFVSVAWRKRRGFAMPTTVPFGADTAPQSITLADVNGDRLREVATGNVNDTASAFEQTGARSFAGPASFMVGDEPQDIEAGKLDENELRDVVTANNLGDTVSVLINDL